MKEITDEQADYMIENRRVHDDILQAAPRVAVILTQDWCPQWAFMKNWLKKFKDEGIAVYYICYNKKPYFTEFMQMKETVWRNAYVPFVLYFRDGELVNTSNFAAQKHFVSSFG